MGGEGGWDGQPIGQQQYYVISVGDSKPKALSSDDTPDPSPTLETRVG